jgi:hypothetical protein
MVLANQQLKLLPPLVDSRRFSLHRLQQLLELRLRPLLQPEASTLAHLHPITIPLRALEVMLLLQIRVASTLAQINLQHLQQRRHLALGLLRLLQLEDLTLAMPVVHLQLLHPHQMQAMPCSTWALVVVSLLSVKSHNLALANSDAETTAGK